MSDWSNDSRKSKRRKMFQQSDGSGSDVTTHLEEDSARIDRGLGTKEDKKEREKAALDRIKKAGMVSSLPVINGHPLSGKGMPIPREMVRLDLPKGVVLAAGSYEVMELNTPNKRVSAGDCWIALATLKGWKKSGKVRKVLELWFEDSEVRKAMKRAGICEGLEGKYQKEQWEETRGHLGSLKCSLYPTAAP